MSKQDHSEKMQSFWLNVFNNSKVNGAEYREDNLPSHTWSWPSDTYLQRRLREVRANAPDEPVIVAQNPTLPRPTLKEVDAVPQAVSQRSTIARRPVDNATRAESNGKAENEKGLVIEWDDIDERWAWFARPSNN